MRTLLNTVAAFIAFAFVCNCHLYDDKLIAAKASSAKSDTGSPVRVGEGDVSEAHSPADAALADASVAGTDAGVLVPDASAACGTAGQPRCSEPRAGIDASRRDDPADECKEPSGCDPLTSCTLRNDAEVCGPCPAGYSGSGETSCAPLLSGIELSEGELEPGFEPSQLKYRVRLPLLASRLEVTASATVRAELQIANAMATLGQPWKSPVLAVGETAVPITLHARSGASTSYELIVERSGGTLDYVKSSHVQMGAKFGFMMSAYGDTLVVGVPYEAGDAGRTSQAGAAYVFVRDGDHWREEAYLTSSDVTTNDMFGCSVSIWRDRIAIGALGHDIFTALGTGTRDGSVHIFVREGGKWRLEERISSQYAERSGDAFGFALAMHEDSLVIGAPLEDDGGVRSGAAYHFTRNAEHWEERQRFKATSPQAESRFGSSIAHDGVTALVGASQESVEGSNRAGAIYAYTLTAAGWSEQQRVVAPTVRPMAQFGYAVAVQGDLLLASAPHNALEQRSQRSGEVHVFQRGAETYRAVRQLAASAPAVGDYFGNSLALNGDKLVVGACGEYSSFASEESRAMPGAAYLFTRAELDFVRTADLSPQVNNPRDNFGYSVAAADSFIAVGAPDEDGSGQDPANNSLSAAGAVYFIR